MSLVIADTAGLVGLDRIGHLTLLAETFSDVVIRAAVAQEFGRVPDGTARRDPEGRALVRQLMSNLGAGEAEVIALALEHPGSLSILDDRPARREARTHGLLVTGTLGVLIRAKRRGHVQRIRPPNRCPLACRIPPLRCALRRRAPAGRRTLSGDRSACLYFD